MLSESTSAANKGYVIHFWHWPDHQSGMNLLTLHLLESIETEPHENTRVIHVYCWRQWRIICLAIRGTASPVSCGCVTDGLAPDSENCLSPIESTWGPGRITVGYISNIWKCCRAIASVIPYLYQGIISVEFHKVFPFAFSFTLATWS